MLTLRCATQSSECQAIQDSRGDGREFLRNWLLAEQKVKNLEVHIPKFYVLVVNTIICRLETKSAADSPEIAKRSSTSSWVAAGLTLLSIHICIRLCPYDKFVAKRLHTLRIKLGGSTDCCDCRVPRREPSQHLQGRHYKA